MPDVTKEGIYNEIEESEGKIRLLENRIAELKAVYIEKFRKFKYGAKVKRYEDIEHKEFVVCFIGDAPEHMFTHRRNNQFVFCYNTLKPKKDGTMGKQHDGFIVDEPDLEEITETK